MPSVTFFRDYDHPAATNKIVAYLQDRTYPDVPNEVAEIVTREGLGEIVSDDLVDPPHHLDGPAPLSAKPVRRRRKGSWDR